MGRQVSVVERFTTWAGIANTLVSLILSALSLFGQLPASIQKVVVGHGPAWWGFLGVLFLAGLWLLWLGLAPKSRLLLPDRFVIRAEQRRYLKGREDEIRELTDLCERQALVFLEGESGSGKSALARAGLADECTLRQRLF